MIKTLPNSRDVPLRVMNWRGASSSTGWGRCRVGAYRLGETEAFDAVGNRAQPFWWHTCAVLPGADPHEQLSRPSPRYRRNPSDHPVQSRPRCAPGRFVASTTADQPGEKRHEAATFSARRPWRGRGTGTPGIRSQRRRFPTIYRGGVTACHRYGVSASPVTGMYSRTVTTATRCGMRPTCWDHCHPAIGANSRRTWPTARHADMLSPNSAACRPYCRNSTVIASPR